MNFGNRYCDEHPEYIVMGICMAIDCKENSRLICFCCATGQHLEHANHVINISDFNKDLIDVKNWPKDDIAIKVKKLIQ